jgi:single-strand selective monofunctional uracil DNA glycosylase
LALDLALDPNLDLALLLDLTLTLTSPPPSSAPRPEPSSAKRLIEAARDLSARVQPMRFAAPVALVYNPLDYAWAGHEAYLRRFATSRRRVVFVGMNPGPFVMMQTGVPFGEVTAVRDWMGIAATIGRPEHEHPKRPIDGFACHRSEISGRRLWGWAAMRFGDAPSFFSECLVLNYCPLVFLEASGRNLVPEKLPVAERAPLLLACDIHLSEAISVLSPEWLIGIGGWAMKRAAAALAGQAQAPRIASILHPSPASPAANRGWEAAADRQLVELGVFAEKPVFPEKRTMPS